MTDPDAVSVEPLANPIINPPYAVPTRHFEIGRGPHPSPGVHSHDPAGGTNEACEAGELGPATTAEAQDAGALQ